MARIFHRGYREVKMPIIENGINFLCEQTVKEYLESNTSIKNVLIVGTNESYILKNCSREIAIDRYGDFKISIGITSEDKMIIYL